MTLDIEREKEALMPNQLDSDMQRCARPRRLRNLRALALALCLPACSAEVLDVGENENALANAMDATCVAAPDTGNSYIVRNQEQLDALEGCKVIVGNLTVVPFESADLHPLHALVRVEGDLAIGWQVFSEQPPPQAEADAMTALIENGWLDSLAGLESLEIADTLTIYGDRLLTSLQPLAQLRHVTNLYVNGVFSDLTGLENVRGMTIVQIGTSNSLDMTALHLPPQMMSLSLQGPIEALDASELSYITNLDLRGTNLQNLDAFQSLSTVEGTLLVMDSLSLVNMDGLNGLQRVQDLAVLGNPALVRLPDFASLWSLEGLVVSSNETLAEFSPFTSLRPREHVALLSGGELESLNVQQIEVHGNPALLQLTLPAGWDRADFVSIGRNEVLKDLDLGGLASADTLYIQDNPALTHVDLGALRTVDKLRVTQNPLLPSTDFDGVRTFESEMEGNASTTHP